MNMPETLSNSRFDLPKDLPASAPEWLPLEAGEYGLLRGYAQASLTLARRRQGFANASERFDRTDFAFNSKIIKPSLIFTIPGTGAAAGAVAHAMGGAAGAVAFCSVIGSLSGVLAGILAAPLLAWAGYGLYAKSKALPAFAGLASLKIIRLKAQGLLRQTGAKRLRELEQLLSKAARNLDGKGLSEDRQTAKLLMLASADLAEACEQKGMLIGVAGASDAAKLAQMHRQISQARQDQLKAEAESVRERRAQVAQELREHLQQQGQSAAAGPADGLPLLRRFELLGIDGLAGAKSCNDFQEAASCPLANEWETAQAKMFLEKRLPALLCAYESIPPAERSVPSSLEEGAQSPRDCVASALREAEICAADLRAAQIERVKLAAQIEARVVSEAARKAQTPKK